MNQTIDTIKESRKSFISQSTNMQASEKQVTIFKWETAISTQMEKCILLNQQEGRTNKVQKLKCRKHIFKRGIITSKELLCTRKDANFIAS